jgi:peptide/nickel transport system substrate-binding protein
MSYEHGAGVSPDAPARRGRSAWRRLSLLVAVALLAAGCGGGDLDGSDAASDSEATSDSDADNRTEEEAANPDNGAAGPSGTLRVGVATNIQSYDPHLAAVAQEYFLHPVYDTLIHPDADGEYGPGLAEDWEWVDSTTLRLSIRPDVSFSDGEPLDAAAVVANFERGRSTEASPSAAFFANIESVEAVDDSTVELGLARPTTSMLDDLSRLPGMMMSPAAFEGDPGTAPVGAGGWVLDADASNPGEVEVFRANPDYWDPDQVQVETVELRVLEADAANNAMLGGEVDIIELRSEADSATFSDGGFELVTRPNANVWYLQMMDTDGSLLEPLADERVRRALTMAIDREAFDEGLQFGEGDPSPSFWLPGTPYYDESLESLAYDPDQARQLLAEAGYEDGFAVSFPSFGTIVPVAESVQQMWGEIGVDVTIDLVEPGTLAEVMRSGGTALTPTLARGFTAESHYLERLSPGGPYDPIGTDRGELPELAEEAFQAGTPEEQEAAWAEVYAYAQEQGYLMVIGHQIPTVVVADGVSGATLLPADNVPQAYGVSVTG